MKVVAFNGSPRKDGNTAMLIGHVFAELEAQGIETEMVSLAGETIRGCTACSACFGKKDQQCVLKDDIVNECIAKMIAADGIILGAPTYFANVPAELKALIDRVGLVSKANDDILQRKVGAAVVAVRRGGAIAAYDAINHFFLINQMIVPGSCYWNLGIGLDKGDVAGDDEGIKTMKTLGRNMAWLLEKVSG